MYFEVHARCFSRWLHTIVCEWNVFVSFLLAFIRLNTWKMKNDSVLLDFFAVAAADDCLHDFFCCFTLQWFFSFISTSFRTQFHVSFIDISPFSPTAAHTHFTSIVAPICSNYQTHIEISLFSILHFCNFFFFAATIRDQQIDNTKSLANGRTVMAKSKLVLVSLRLKRQTTWQQRQHEREKTSTYGMAES